MANTTSTRTGRTQKTSSPAKRVKQTVGNAETRVAQTVRKQVRQTGTGAKARTGTKRRARAKRSGSSIDAIALLKKDHREVRVLFHRFERSGDGAHRTKSQLSIG